MIVVWISRWDLDMELVGFSYLAIVPKVLSIPSCLLLKVHCTSRYPISQHQLLSFPFCQLNGGCLPGRQPNIKRTTSNIDFESGQSIPGLQSVLYAWLTCLPGCRRLTHTWIAGSAASTIFMPGLPASLEVDLVHSALHTKLAVSLHSW